MTHVHTYADANLVQRAHCRAEDCDACRLAAARTSTMLTLASIQELNDAVAWGRAETDDCERGTPGCSVRHTAGDTDCQPW